MKIGIISSYAFIKNNNNYGALLQYYALEKYLIKRGHKVYWIRTVIFKNTILNIFRKLKIYKSFIMLIRWLYVHKEFIKFVKDHLNYSEHEYNGYESITKNPPVADAYITGSDQVWGSAELKENYLLFAPNLKPRIAYAASFGDDSISLEMGKTIKPWLKEFKAISVRERSGIDICKGLMVNAEHLIDPTLLISPLEYPSSKKSRFKLPYIYCYFLNINGLDSIYWKDIIEYAESKNCKLYVSAVQGAERFIPNKYLVTPNPENWITDFKHAMGIFTNSFHGTIFALIHHRPFVTIMQKGISAKQNTRMISLLRMFNLEDHIWIGQDNIYDILEKPVDWETFEKKKNRFIQKTNLFFLKNNI